MPSRNQLINSFMATASTMARNYIGGHCKLCFGLNWYAKEAHAYPIAPCAELFRSATDGCETCQVLEKVVQELCPVGNPAETLVSFQLWGTSIDYKSTAYPELIVSPPGRAEVRLELYQDNDSRWPWFETRRHLPEDTASEESHRWATAQLQQCLEKHSQCNAGLDVDHPVLPSRVLDLGSHPNAGDSIKVLETRGLRGRYIALSHCWGDPKLLSTKLTAHTQETYKNKISLDALPKTFREAVEFTRKINIRYLWIDSLCIIQSDPENDSSEDKELSLRDWLQESGRMCEVYMNSHLTLAALSSTACTGGLFFQPKTLEMKGRAAGRHYHIFARENIQHHPKRFPLMKRGWVHQEYLLSPRTLLFGEGELVWRCVERSSCQCGEHRIGFGQTEFDKLPRTVVGENLPSKWQLMQRWYRIVENYSLASLSVPSDELVALDGIAQYMRPLRDCDYLAGLWSDSLAFDLVWIVTLSPTAKPGTTTQQIEASTPDQQTFPTWTWASVTSPVHWSHLILSRYEPLEDSDIFVSQLPGSSAYALRLRGVLVPSLLVGDVAGVKPYVADDEWTASYYPDQVGDSDLTGQSDIYCLRVLKNGIYSLSLVLRCKDKRNELYERVGLLRGDSKRLTEENGGTPGIRGRYRDPWNHSIEGYTPRWDFLAGWEAPPVTITLV
ncbi:heterokaryon incompatibility protein-domain-containing protein [Cercophora newfieldiana]|uniref:Heterokaryon incompatibility protein-domain-containing protein n=1 Tax=Cercophora newfieldiana TaxID=92897 RepID=A0AA40CL18_9PEZI|nr:heterokaryon incompatibility protein-domain-containing protein [Cercophora newfieldiana]